MDISLSTLTGPAGALGPATPPGQGGSGGSGGPGGGLAGILDAQNVVILGASVMRAAMGGASTGSLAGGALRDFATAAGFTGTLYNYAESGNTVSSTIGHHQTAQTALAATAGQNLYIVHTGGNNVSSNRPYPGGEGNFSSDYATLMANITATDTVIPLPLTKRLYGIGDAGYPGNTHDVVQGDAASEVYGAQPYIQNIILPAIASHAPDWLKGDGSAYVDPYAFVDAHPWILGPDGVHGPNFCLGRYILAGVAARARGQSQNDSRSGTAILYDIRKADPNTARAGLSNLICSFTDGDTKNPLFPGAMTTDGGFDPFTTVRMGSFQNNSDNTFGGTGVFNRLADSRFHDHALINEGIYVTTAKPLTLTFSGLPVGSQVQISCCGCRQASGAREGRLTLTGGQSLVLNAATDAASNQVVFAPETVPADGILTLTYAPETGSSYGYLHGVILDFL